jgi:hypothetical protein
MDPKIYKRLWDETFEARQWTTLYRSVRHKHPLVVKLLADDARGSDPAVNPLHFLHRPKFRNPIRRRRLRILNALLWMLKIDGFALQLDRDDKNIVVGHGWHHTKFSMFEEGTTPLRATTPGRTKLTGRLSCKIEARLPAGVPRHWADELGDALETRIPNILASFAVWAAMHEHHAGLNTGVS